MRAELVPDAKQIHAWIETIFDRGIRRPGTPADRWTEQFCLERFRAFGLGSVRLEPVRLPAWEPREWSLRVDGPGGALELPCFPLPHSAPTEERDLELVAWNPDSPTDAKGKAVLEDVRLVRLPATAPAARAARQGAGLSEAERIVDPRGTFAEATHLLPFGPRIQWVLEPALEAGAAAWIGALVDYPGDSCEYYVPYDAEARAIPGLWIRGSDGARLRALLAAGPVRVRLRVDSRREEIVSHNVVGELPGADDEWVVIGSHHDGPWASAVEDASGVALVLAQAAYWSRVPREERPHRLVFLLNAGHMAGGTGCLAFLEAHAANVERIVLEIHLEHAAREFAGRDGTPAPTGEPEVRWFFTSRIPALERAVADALAAEE
ncbi:MAG: M28 family peptidase, partial [Myxococcota bacterium]